MPFSNPLLELDEEEPLDDILDLDPEPETFELPDNLSPALLADIEDIEDFELVEEINDDDLEQPLNTSQKTEDPETRLVTMCQTLSRWYPKAIPYKDRALRGDPTPTEIETSLRNVYTVIKLPPSGEGKKHHHSLFAAFVRGIRYCEVSTNTESAQFQGFRSHLIKLYQDENYELSVSTQQVDYLIKELIPNGSDFIDRIEDPNRVSVGTFDTESIKRNLRNFVRTKHSKLFILSPEPNPETIPTKRWLNKMFNTEIRTHKERENQKQENIPTGYISTTLKAEGFWGAYRPSKRYWPEGVDNHQFTSRAVFKTEDSRKKDNLLYTPWMVVECDINSLEMQERFLTMILKVKSVIPLACIIFSGNKSYHAWINVSGLCPKKDKDILNALHQLFVPFGADPAVLNNPVALLRTANVMPPKDIQHKRGHQTLHYYDESQVNPDTCHDITQETIQQIEEILRGEMMPEIYFHKGKGKFIITTSKGECQEMSLELTRKHLMASYGYRGDKLGVEVVAPVDTVINHIQDRNNTNGFLPLAAGHAPGPFDPISRIKMEDRNHPSIGLVIGQAHDSIRPISKTDERYGVFDTIRNFGISLLGEMQFDILETFMSRMCRAIWNDGKDHADFTIAFPYLHIVGDSGSGKTFFVNQIIAGLALGYSDPGPFLAGADFNDEIASHYLKWADDSRDLTQYTEVRSIHSETFKSLVVGGSTSIHAKFCDRIDIPLVNVLIRTLNPSKLSTLPLMEQADVREKIVLLQASSEKLTSRQASKLELKFGQQIPAYYTYLVRDFVPKEESLDPQGRYACRTYHDPGLLEGVMSHSPTGALRSLLSVPEFNLTANTSVEDTQVFEGNEDELFLAIQDAIGAMNDRRHRYVLDYNKRVKNSDELEESLKGLIEDSEYDIVTKVKSKRHGHLQDVIRVTKCKPMSTSDQRLFDSLENEGMHDDLRGKF